MKKKEKIALIAALLLTTSLVAGCGNKSADQQTNVTKPGEKGETADKITITFAEHVADVETNAPQVYKIVQAFNAANPDVEVIIESAASDEHTTKMKLAAQTNSLPDVFYRISGDAVEMAKAGYLADLTADIKADPEFADRFLPGMLDSMVIDGKTYGIPSEMFVNGIWYNKALFDQCGLELPVTFEDMLHCAEVFRANGITPMARGNKSVFSCWSTWTMHCRYGFYDHIDGIIAGTDKWNNPDYLKFYNMIKTMSDSGMFSDNMKTMGYDEAQKVFMSGQAAMFDSGAWDTAQFENCEFADSIGFWWGPTFSDGVGEQEIAMKAPSHPYCISAKTQAESPEKYEAAIRFLKFFYSEEGTQLVVDANCVPVTKYDGTIDAEKYPVFANIMARINDDWSSPLVCPNVYLGAFETTYFESIIGVMNGVYTPEEAMDFLDEQSVIQGLVAN